MNSPIERLTSADQLANKSVYELVHSGSGIDDGWDEATKQDNFGRLSRIEDFCEFPLSGAKVLDVGCGTGDFFPCLQEKGIGEYLGIDVLSSSIVKAREKYPDGIFRQGDFLVEPKEEMFDYAFCSGAFWARIPSGNLDFIRSILQRMWEVSRVGIGFNYEADETTWDPNGAFSTYSRKEVRGLGRQLGAVDSVSTQWFPEYGVMRDTVLWRKT